MHAAAKRLRSTRKQRGETQFKAAEMVGVHLNTWSRWEKGDRPKTLPHFFAIADYLGVTCDALRVLLRTSVDSLQSAA